MSGVPTTRSQKRKSDNLTDQGTRAAKKPKPDGFISGATLKTADEENPDGEGDCVYVRRRPPAPKVDLTAQYKKGPPRGKPPIRQANGAGPGPSKNAQKVDSEVIILDSPPKKADNSATSASETKGADESLNPRTTDGGGEPSTFHKQATQTISHTRTALHLKHMPFFSSGSTRFGASQSPSDRQSDDQVVALGKRRNHRLPHSDKVVAGTKPNFPHRPQLLTTVDSQKTHRASEGLRIVIPQNTLPPTQPTTSHDEGMYRISGSPISDNESDQEEQVVVERSDTTVVGVDIPKKPRESSVIPTPSSKEHAPTNTVETDKIPLKIASSTTDAGRSTLTNGNVSSDLPEGAGVKSTPITISQENTTIRSDSMGNIHHKVASSTSDNSKYAVEKTSMSSSVNLQSQGTEPALSQSTLKVADHERPVGASNAGSHEQSQVKEVNGEAGPGSLSAESREDALVGTQNVPVGPSPSASASGRLTESAVDQEPVAAIPTETKEVGSVANAVNNQSRKEFLAQQPSIHASAQSSDALLDTRYKIRQEAFKCFLGYGIASLATDDDFGRGPLMKPQTRNVRTNNAGGQKAFRQAIQFDPRYPDKEPAQLARYLPSNAVEVAVSGKSVVLSSLTKNPHTSLFPNIQWVNDPAVHPGENGERFQGATRAEYVRDWASSALRQLDVVDRQLTSVASSSSTNAAKLKPLINERKKLRETIIERTSWLFAMYDLDMINASPLAHDILLFLSLNNPSYQRPDSEVAAMRITITHLLSYPKEQMEAKLKSDTLDPSVTFHNSNRRFASVFKDNPLFLSLVEFHRYSLLWPWKSITPTSLDALRPVASPFVEAILVQATAMLNFLSSARSLDEFVEDDTARIDLESLREHLLEHPPTPIADFFDTQFVDIVTSCYKEELHPHHKLFGTSRSFGSTDYYTYQGATQRYNHRLPAKLSPWLDRRQIFAKASGETELHKALQEFPLRLELIFRGLFNSELFGMCLSTPSPIPCPLFYSDAVDGLAIAKPYLQAAFAWIDAFATDKNTVNHNRGLTFALKDAIRSLKPTTSEDITLNLILGEIYSMRNIAFAAMKNAEARVESPYPIDATPAQLLKLPVWNDLHSHTVALIKDWYGKASANHAKVDKVDEVLFSPVFLKQVLDDTHGRAIINALTRTTFPWWEVGPAKASYRIKAASKRVIAVVASAAYQDEVYADVEPYWHLRERIAVVLDNNTSMFQALWDGLTSPYPERTPSQPASLMGIPYSGRLALEAKAASIRRHTQKAIEQIALAVCEEYNGAIPISIDQDHAVFRPHHDVHQAAVGLIRVLALASHQAQQTYLDPSSETRIRVCGPDFIEELLASLRLPSQFAPASFDDIIDFYAPHNRKSAMDLQTLGFGFRGKQRRNEARFQSGGVGSSPFSTPQRRRLVSFSMPSGSQISNGNFSIPIASSPPVQGPTSTQNDGIDAHGPDDEIIDDEEDEDDDRMDEDAIEEPVVPLRSGLDSDVEEVPDSQSSYSFPPLNQLATQSRITPSVRPSLPVPPPAPRRLSNFRPRMSPPSSSLPSRDSFGAPVLSQHILQLADLHEDEEEMID